MLVLIAHCYGRMIHFPLQEHEVEITAVSRHHFSLTHKRNGWLVRDLGSTNGTRVNGDIIKETIVKVNDKIQAGIVEFQLKRSDEDMIAVRREEAQANQQPCCG